MVNRVTTFFSFQEQGSGLKKIKADISAATTTTGKFKAAISGAMGELVNSRAAQAAIAGIVVKLGTDAVNAASDLEESVSAVRGTFGEYADDILAIGENSAESFGMSYRAFNDFAVRFSAFAQQIAERDGRTVVEVTEEMAGRISDFASRYNLTMEEAAQVAQSTLAGETEGFRRFGGDVSAATVKIYAWKHGIAETGEELTEGQKVLARYGVFMEQTAGVAGDFKRTQEGLANSQRTLQASVEDLQAAMGEGLAPEVAKAVQTITKLTDVAKSAPGPLGDIAKQMRLFVDPLEQARKGFGALSGLWKDAPDELNVYGRAVQNAMKAGINAEVANQKWVESLRDGSREATYTADAYDEMGRIQRTVNGVIDRATEAQRRFMESIRHSRDEVGALRREISDEQAWVRMQMSIESAVAKLGELDKESLEYKDTLASLRLETLAYAESLNLPDSVVTMIDAKIDPNDMSYVNEWLARLGNGVTLPIRPKVINTGGGSSVRIDEFGNAKTVGYGAEGGIVTKPTLAVIGEAGPEAVVPLNKMPGASPLPSGGGSSSTININVTAGMGADGAQIGKQVAEALERYYRSGGRRV